MAGLRRTKSEEVGSVGCLIPFLKVQCAVYTAIGWVWYTTASNRHAYAAFAGWDWRACKERAGDGTLIVPGWRDLRRGGRSTAVRLWPAGAGRAGASLRPGLSPKASPDEVPTRASRGAPAGSGSGVADEPPRGHCG